MISYYVVNFSASSRVTTFLSVVSRYHVQCQHISGIANIPADYASRNPQECPDHSCQLCKFIAETEYSVVRSITVQDVVNGYVRMPFTSRVAWLASQHECPDLRRVHSHLSQGTRPTKKMTKIPDVKRYLRVLTIASDGLLVVREDKPFHPTRERIVVPRQLIDGLLTAVHLRFSHPSPHQMKQVFNRYFYGLDIDRAVQAVCSACHHCSSLKSMPSHFQPQSSEKPPDRIGVSLAADVIRRYRQCILVVRETVSSYTLTSFIPSEKHEDLRDALVVLCSELLPLGNEGIVIRVDPAPGFTALVSDPILKQYGIALEIGRAKNVNKNPVAERAIEELGLECLHLSPEGVPLTKVTLALATANMNSRIQKGRLSALEVWTQRDQISGEQMPIEDHQVILNQHHLRAQNHGASSLSKSRGKPQASAPPLQVGDLVYLKADRDKTMVRDKYMVASVDSDRCQLRKFTQSQFRSKTYDVRLCDCYPISSTVLEQWPPGPVRGMDYGGNDQYMDSERVIVHHDISCDPPPLDCSVTPQCISPPTPPAAIITPPSVQSPGRDEHRHMEIPIDPDTPTMSGPHSLIPSFSSDGSPPLRRSCRTRKAPSWQTSDTWELQ